MDIELQEEFMIWRLVVEKVCTLKELETWWSIDDILRANAILDMRAYHQEETKPKEPNDG